MSQKRLRIEHRVRFTASASVLGMIEGGTGITQTQAKRREGPESVHEDVQSFFGETEGRWRILKLPLQYWHRRRIGNVFFSCCTLQNMLHACDGLAELEVNTDWTGDAALHDAFYSDPYTDFSRVG
ncbi:unnamed protein product, partial [Discosporangium mesarthrocarpum]